MILKTVKPFPTNDKVIPRPDLQGAVCDCLLHGAAGFSMRRVVVTSADGLGQSASPLFGKIGAR